MVTAVMPSMYFVEARPTLRLTVVYFYICLFVYGIQWNRNFYEHCEKLCDIVLTSLPRNQKYWIPLYTISTEHNLKLCNRKPENNIVKVEIANILIELLDMVIKTRWNFISNVKNRLFGTVYNIWHKRMVAMIAT